MSHLRRLLLGRGVMKGEICLSAPGSSLRVPPAPGDCSPLFPFASDIFLVTLTDTSKHLWESEALVS
ncbi:hypothetical protein XELAEV_18003067mg [Xenopus laevis]|uniref:Uncharacterized protein n=1 Tax=Xenopus laevis TaxID=8355 RepID=A0A974GZ15_XENLA|nr:hypothetical protein XELAEV_18003067mg [Xenopus laevis]